MENGFDDVLSFWFDGIDSKKWWTKDTEFDRLIQRRFGETHARAAAGELYEWRRSPHGRLAEVIVLDQFSRNMFRDTAKSFEFDALALVLAQEAVATGADQEIPAERLPFLYMPFMHSESRVIHRRALELFEALGRNVDFERKHKVIIDRFGRYPHRNEILGRPSTAEETEFLQRPGSSF